MSNPKYEVNFSFLKLGFWSTVILAILKLANVIDISNWLVFLPLLIAVGGFVFIVFLIGLITLYFIDRELDKQEKEKNIGETNEDS